MPTLAIRATATPVHTPVRKKVDVAEAGYVNLYVQEDGTLV
jgi:hypothetical protein